MCCFRLQRPHDKGERDGGASPHCPRRPPRRVESDPPCPKELLAEPCQDEAVRDTPFIFRNLAEVTLGLGKNLGCGALGVYSLQTLRVGCKGSLTF